MPEPPNTHGVSNDLGARIALFVLRATSGAPRVLREPRFMFLPSAETLPEARAVEVLAALEKPVRCRAELIDGKVAIRCKKNQEPELVQLHQQLFQDRTRSLRAGVTANGVPLSDEHRILLRAGQDTLLTTVRDLEQFEREYFVSYTSAVDKPSSADFSRGAVAEYHVWPVAAWTFEGPGVRIEGTPGPESWWP